MLFGSEVIQRVIKVHVGYKISKKEIYYKILPMLWKLALKKYKFFINSDNQKAPTNITMYGQRVEEVYSFKYFVSVFTKDGKPMMVSIILYG